MQGNSAKHQHANAQHWVPWKQHLAPAGTHSTYLMLTPYHTKLPHSSARQRAVIMIEAAVLQW